MRPILLIMWTAFQSLYCEMIIIIIIIIIIVIIMYYLLFISRKIAFKYAQR